MKKLMTLVLLAAFAVGCTATSVEDDYEIQIIDKKEYETPTDKKDTPKPKES